MLFITYAGPQGSVLLVSTNKGVSPFHGFVVANLKQNKNL